MDCREINLDDWTLAGGGAQGESYFSKTDDSLILKLFTKELPKEYAEQELNIAQKVAAAGLPCPKLYELITAEGRYGHIGQRIKGKKSFARAAAENPEKIPELAARMAKLALQLHSTSSEGQDVPSFNQELRTILETQSTMSEDLKQLFRKCLDCIPECKTLIHGDFHFGNLITNGTDDYLIDLGFFSYGDPRHDIASFFITSNLVEDKTIEYLYHMDTRTARKFWNSFAEAYYGADGPVPTNEELKKELAPFMLLRTLVYEHDLGPNPELDDIRKDLRRFLPDEPASLESHK